MPQKKGRARNTVPQQYDRSSKKAARPCKTTPVYEFDPTCRVLPSSLSSPDDEESLPLPSDVWLRIVTFVSPSELCRTEILNKISKCILFLEEACIWESFCHLDFPSMWASVKSHKPDSVPPRSNDIVAPYLPSSRDVDEKLGASTKSTVPVDVVIGENLNLHVLQNSHQTATSSITPDWKLLYIRRCLKQRAWDSTRGRSRSSSEVENTKPTSLGRVCLACGERLASLKDSACISHPGEFLPRTSIPGRSLEHLELSSTSREWSKAELTQLQQLVRAAWRSAGGSSGVCCHARNYRGGGHWAKHMSFKGWGSRGHWAEGCGPRPGSALLRDCIDGKIACSWSCCGSEELISRGCTEGVHR